MRYFSYIAEQSFKTSPNGQRLFYRGGQWSVPYIVPNPETEKILLKKQTWMLRLFLGLLILGQPFLFQWKPEVVEKPYWFLSFLLIIMSVNWLIGNFVFARDLKNLKRAEAKLGLKSFYEQMAQTHSKSKLVIGLIASIIFVAGGISILATGRNWALGIGCLVIFGPAVIAWGYALKTKFKNLAE